MVARKLYVRFGWAHRWLTPRSPRARQAGVATEAELASDHVCSKVEAISLESWTVDIKKRKDTAKVHPEAVFGHDIVDSQVQAEALVRLVDYVAKHGLLSEGPHQAARDLLMVAAPRLGGEVFKRADETTLAAAMRIAPPPRRSASDSGSTRRGENTYWRAHDLHACQRRKDRRRHRQ